MVKTEERLLILPDFVFILKEFEKGDTTLTDLQIKTRMTYAHLFYLKNKMIEYNWIRSRQEGVSKHLSLTEKGIGILQAVNNLIDKLELDKNNLEIYRRSKNYSKKINKQSKDINSEQTNTNSEQTNKNIEQTNINSEQTNEQTNKNTEQTILPEV